MNALAPDVSLVGEIANETYGLFTLIHIAAGNHDFDFGTLEQSHAMLHPLKKALRISTSLYTNTRHQICG
jgi:hypothetical protein